MTRSARLAKGFVVQVLPSMLLAFVLIWPSTVAGETTASESAKWQFDTVLEGSYGGATSIAASLDENGDPFLGFYMNGTMNLATIGPGGSSITRIVPGYVYDEPSVARDHQGIIHLYWGDGHFGPGGGLLELNNSGGVWRLLRLDLPSEEGIGRPYAFFDSSNHLNLVYLEYYTIWGPVFGHTVSRVKHATFSGGAWDIQTIFDNNSTITSFSTVVLSDGRIDCAFGSETGGAYPYYSDSNTSVVYLTNRDGQWRSENISENGSKAYFGWEDRLVLRVGRDGNPVMTYLEAGPKVDYGPYSSMYNLTLVLATRSSTGWTRTNISSDFRYNTLAMDLDSKGRVHILIQDGINGDPLYISNESGIWSTERLETIGESGDYPAVVVDSKDSVHLFYYRFLSGWSHYLGSGDLNLVHVTLAERQKTSLSISGQDAAVAGAGGILAFGIGLVAGRRWPR